MEVRRLPLHLDAAGKEPDGHRDGSVLGHNFWILREEGLGV